VLCAELTQWPQFLLYWSEQNAGVHPPNLLLLIEKQILFSKSSNQLKF
jgi:hypothetical protein